jgi:predicted  nucleic acid-binding Zn-ribbon protein
MSTTAIKSGQDPWTDAAKDPWANYGRSTLPSQQGDGKTRLDALQSKLREDLGSKLAVDLEQHAQAAVKAATASSGSANGQHEHRLKALEVGLQELQGQNAQFTTWFQQAGDRLQSTEATMGAMQQTLNTHQHEIHALGSTFQATMKNVKDDLSSEMTDSFNKQLSRLEALLEKKQRQA